MTQAKNGDTVKVHYTGKLENGLVFDSSIDREPLEFTIGDGQLVKGFETGVTGMQIGEKKTLRIKPDEGYGRRNEELVAKVDRSHLPDSIEATVGQALQVKQPSGHTIQVIITEISGDSITLDANHPLAGKKLQFEVNLVEIV